MPSSAFIRFLKDAENKGSLSYHEALPLSGVSTVGTGGAADFFVLPNNVSALCIATRAALLCCVPYIVVGNSSDLFYHDLGFRGAVICAKKLSALSFENGFLSAGCGCMMPSLSSFAQKNGLSGFEGLCSIPGTVGGGLCLNASAYGQSVSDLLLSYTVYYPEKDVFIEKKKEEGKFSYRKSKVGEKGGIVLSAVFCATLDDPEAILRRMEQNREKRKKTQPIGKRSAGSFYKRTESGLSAGEIIERCGLKGLSSGGAQVSEKHANFFINTGFAKTSDFEKLSETVSGKVFEKTGITLEKEVIFLKEK